jgi:acetate kinase
MAAAMGGLDALAFTGGIGENSARVRADTTAGLRFLGLILDAGLNDGARPDAVVSPPGAPVITVVIRAREELEVAREVEARLTARA